MKNTLIAFALYIGLAACGGNDKQDHSGHNAATAAPKTKSESLYKDVMALHDEAMPKMGKIIGYKKTLEQKIDSLSGLISQKANANQEKLREEYKDLLARVSAAEKGMNEWMEQFEPDPKMPTEADIEKYFEEQKAKAQKMRDDIMVSLDSAKAKLGL
jgi:hypothetical protein